MSDPVLEVVQRHASERANLWFERGLPRPDGVPARGLFFGFFAGAGRRFGADAPDLSTDEAQVLRESGLVEPSATGLDTLARIALLRAALAVLPPEEHLDWIREAYQKGDNRERIAVLQSLPLLSEPPRFAELALDACRTNVVQVFEAIACDNDFPHRYFPESGFNQLVMQAVFLGLPLARVQGLSPRRNPELSRMAKDFRADRQAAGRPVPPDLALVSAPTEGTP